MRHWRPTALAAACLGLAAALPAAAQNATVERGRYLVEAIGGCGNCHTPKGPDGQDLPDRGLAGGQVLEEPNIFRGITRNITPDREHGIGGWTDDQAIRAITQGLRPDGNRLGPPMGYGYYARMNERNLRDIVAYLRTLPACP